MVQKQTLEKIKERGPFVCMGISLLMLLFATLILPLIVKSSIQNQIKMNPDTFEYWGQNPGATHTVVKRNFTFFNFTNPRNFLYRNQQPVFQQINGFLLQQRSNFTNLKYSEDMTQLDYDYWLYFTEMQGSRNLDEKLNLINVAPLGFWYQIDKVGLPTFALQGFGGLFVELKQTFKTQAIGQGISGQYLPEYENWQQICSNIQLTPKQCNISWFDPQIGLSDENNYEVWVLSSKGDKSSEFYIKNYFGFNDMQMFYLMKSFKDWTQSINEILNNWFCDGSECDSYDLTLRQLSSGEITSNPPTGDSAPSICQIGNVTCIGQPQISTFLKGTFRQIYPDTKYQSLKFSTTTFAKLFSPYNGTLLNIGNLTDLFATGQQYDKTTDLDIKQQILQLITYQTHAQSNDHAFVIWEWVKYFTNEFVIKKTKGGSQKNSGIGGVFAQAFYETFTQFGQWILDEYLSLIATESLTEGCKEFVNKIIPGIDNHKIQMICSQIEDSMHGYSKLIEPCFSTLQAKEQFRTNNTLSLRQMAEYCDQEQASFYTLGSAIHEKIYTHYGCSPAKQQKICSPYELSLKQFINSSITLNPIPNNIKTYASTLSGHNWNKQLGQFQYKNFLKEVYDDEQIDKPSINQLDLIDLLSFDKLFSAPMVMELMLEEDQDNFQKLFYWKNMTLLKQFVKFVTVEVGFGGFTQKRSPREMLLGYEDPFLKNLKQTDTMLGGDPSINPVVMVNEPNITEQEAYMFPQSVNTGYSDPQLTRQFISLNDKTYMTYNKTFYDGYQIWSQFINPFQKQDYLKGSDATQNPPDLSSDSTFYCMLTNVYRYAKMKYVADEKHSGIGVLKFQADDSFIASEKQLPQNAIYYQGERGFLNMSFLGVPLYVSKNNFLDCDKKWRQSLSVMNADMTKEIMPTEDDNTVVEVEPNSGALIFASVRLQTNYFYQKDDILFTPQSTMLPINFVIREGEVSEDTVNDLFGPLKAAATIQTVLIVLSILGGLGSAGYYSYYLHQKKKRNSLSNTDQIKKPLVDKLKNKSVTSKGSHVNINPSLAQTFKE